MVGVWGNSERLLKSSGGEWELKMGGWLKTKIVCGAGDFECITTPLPYKKL